MNIKEMIKVMEHSSRGGKVEYENCGIGNWSSCAEPIWNFDIFTYRIDLEQQKVISHFEGGGEIEWKNKGGTHWRMTVNYHINWSCNDYRIKEDKPKLPEEFATGIGYPAQTDFNVHTKINSLIKYLKHKDK